MKIIWIQMIFLHLTGYSKSTSTWLCSGRDDCFKCPDNCERCKSSTECEYKCKFGYGGPNCELSCDHCDGDCDSEEGCSDNCTPGYYLDQGECHRCSNNCITCTSETDCEICMAGYRGTDCLYLCDGCEIDCRTDHFFKDGRCAPCPDNCESCSTGTECEKCTNGYWGPLCQYSCNNCTDSDCTVYGCSNKCSYGFYLSSSRQCIECPNNCTKCSGATVCTECKVGFIGSTCQDRFCANDEYLKEYDDNRDNRCLKCPSECHSCTDSLHCITCKNGYFGSRCQHSCEGCSNNCDITVGCTGQCTMGYFKPEISGFLNTDLQICKKCPNECKSCISSSQCDNCAAGRWGITCQEFCNSGCLHNKCEIEYGRCLDECIVGWAGLKCDKRCNTGCVQCDQGNNSICMICESGYFGGLCERTCSSNCILPSDKGASVCKRHSGDCLWGCQPTWWGKLCENKCSAFCNGTECNMDDGSCEHGCIDRYTGTFCSREQSLAATEQGSGNDGILIGVAAGCGLLFLVIVTGVVIFIMLKRGRKNPTQDSSRDIPLSKQTAKSTAKPLNHQTYEDLDETQNVETEYDGLDKDAYYIYIDDNTSKLHASSADEYTSVCENDLSVAQICKSDKENASERSLRFTHEDTDILSSNSNPIAINQKKENSCNGHSRNNQHDDQRTETCHDYLVLDECNDEQVKVQNNVYEYLESSSSPVYNVLDSVQKETAGLKNAEISCLDRTAESTYHILEPTSKEMYEPEGSGHEEANDTSESTYNILEPITNEPICAADVSRSGETTVESESQYHILEPIEIKSSCAPNVSRYEVTTAGTESTYHILEPISSKQNAPLQGETTVDSESTYHILEPNTNEKNNAPDTNRQA